MVVHSELVPDDAFARNAADPTIGSGMQQARNFWTEKTVEVVQNHEDGTCSAVVPKSRRRQRSLELTFGGMSMEG
jgi:hypothetical protein